MPHTFERACACYSSDGTTDGSEIDQLRWSSVLGRIISIIATLRPTVASSSQRFAVRAAEVTDLCRSGLLYLSSLAFTPGSSLIAFLSRAGPLSVFSMCIVLFLPYTFCRSMLVWHMCQVITDLCRRGLLHCPTLAWIHIGEPFDCSFLFQSGPSSPMSY